MPAGPEQAGRGPACSDGLSTDTGMFHAVSPSDTGLGRVLDRCGLSCRRVECLIFRGCLWKYTKACCNNRYTDCHVALAGGREHEEYSFVVAALRRSWKGCLQVWRAYNPSYCRVQIVAGPLAFIARMAKRNITSV